MTQINLPMLTVYSGPTLVHPDLVDQCKTYRDAVRMCWELRKRRLMTRSMLAEESECYPSHITDFLSEDDSRRELPAKRIGMFEQSCGNRCITQWLATQAGLTILETLMQRKAA
jgi:hypothetical protein